MSHKISRTSIDRITQPPTVRKIEGKYYLYPSGSETKHKKITGVAIPLLKREPKNPDKYTQLKIDHKTYYVKKKVLKERFNIKETKSRLNRRDLREISSRQKTQIVGKKTISKQTTEIKPKREVKKAAGSKIETKYAAMKGFKIPESEVVVNDNFLKALSNEHKQMIKNKSHWRVFEFGGETFTIVIKDEKNIQNADVKVYFRKGEPKSLGVVGDIHFLYNIESVYRRASNENLTSSEEVFRGGKAWKRLKSNEKLKEPTEKTERTPQEAKALAYELSFMKTLRENEDKVLSKKGVKPEGSENVIKGHGISYQGEKGILMKRYDGNLSELLRRKGPDALTLKQRFNIAAQVARGLAYMHSQKPPIYHFDLKPDNILFIEDKKNKTFQVVLTDLGSANTLDNAREKFQSEKESALRGSNSAHYSYVDQALLSTTIEDARVDPKIFDSVAQNMEVRALAKVIGSILTRDPNFAAVAPDKNLVLTPNVTSELSGVLGVTQARQFVQFMNNLMVSPSNRELGPTTERMRSGEETFKESNSDLFLTSATTVAHQLDSLNFRIPTPQTPSS